MPTETMEKTVLDQVEANSDHGDGESGSEKRQAEIKPRTADEWVRRVEARLEEVLSRQREFKEIAAIAKSQQEKRLKSLGKDEVRELVEALELTDVESLLEELRDIEQKSGAKSSETKQVVLYERQLEQVAAEKVVSRRQMESVSRISTTNSLQEQVFKNFSEFLVKGARVKYGGDKFEARMTSDGVYVISVPEPTFDNMLKLASLMDGKFQEKSGNTPEDFAQQLMDAALVMDRQAIFSSEAIEALYNAGLQLKNILQKKPQEHASLRDIQQRARQLFGEGSFAQRKQLQEKLNQVYLNIFLEKHDVTFVQDGKGLHVERRKDAEGKEMRRTLYDALFEKWQSSQEGKKWLKENNGLLRNLQDPKVRAKIIEAYDKWLCEPKRQFDMMQKLKKYIELKVIPGSETRQQLGVLLPKWRHLLLQTESAKIIAKQIDEKIEQQTPEQQLATIIDFFQPGQKPQALKYLPADVLAVFQDETSTSTQRNEAACVIADTYVKKILQDRGFKVFVNLKNTHTRLVALNPQDGKAYFVDPNAPRGEAAVIEIKDSELLGELREKAAGGKWEAKKNIVVSRKDVGVIADGDALLRSALFVNMVKVANPPLSKAVQFAVAEQAVLQFPKNPLAYLRMAQTVIDTDPMIQRAKQQEYLHKAHELDPNITEEALGKEMLIGAWNPPALPGGVVNPDLDAVVARANAWIAASRNPGGGLRALSESQLQVLNQMMGEAMRPINPLTDPDLSVAAIERQKEIIQALHGDEISAFYLTTTEKEIFTKEGPDQIRDLIEAEIAKFARGLEPGKAVDPQTSNQMEIRFRDMITVLSARTPDAALPPEAKQRELDYLVKMGKALQGAPAVAARIESGDPEMQKQAQQAANFMDERGGLAVLDQLYTMHNGRVGGLVSDLRREMRKQLEKNYESSGKFYILQEQYKSLPVDIINRVVGNAMSGVNGIGDYARFRRQDPNNPNSPLLADPNLQRQKVEEQVRMDIKFAQVVFIITGEASSIYIRSRMPDSVRDLGAGAFLNSQWQDVERYGLLSSANKKVRDAQMRHAAEERLREVYGETVARRMIKNERFFDFYVEQNGIDILAPVVQMWWENRAVRTWQMIESLNQYEKDYDAKLRAAGQPRWTRQLPDGSLQEGYVQPTTLRVETKNNEAYEVPVGGNPEFGIMLRAFLYHDSVSKNWEESERILSGKGADYYADVIFEPFAYQSAMGQAVEGISGDKRFVKVFNGQEASFLENVNITGQFKRVEQENARRAANHQPLLPLTLDSELQLIMESLPAERRTQDMRNYQRALLRFNIFQDYIRPAMDALRNQRINNANPRQTNFALNDTGVNQMLTSLGINDQAFRNLISAMQNQIRYGDMAHDMVYDPMFENQWYSPLTVIDMPMWMIDGKDLSGDYANSRDLHSQMGGNNILGRYLGDVQELGWKTRAGVIGFIQNNPNNVNAFFKIMEEQIAPGIGNTRGPEAAHEIEFMMITKMFLMQYPQLADAFGMKDGVAGIRFENTDYRKIYGSRIGSLSREEILALAEEHIIPRLPAKLKARMRRRLKITNTDLLKRKAGQSLFIFLLLTIFGTAETVFGAVNPANQQAA